MKSFLELGDMLIKFVCDNWQYWWIVLLGTIAIGIYIIWK